MTPPYPPTPICDTLLSFFGKNERSPLLKILRPIALTFVALLAIVAVIGIIAYADGNSLPVNHTISVTGTIAAPPAKVFARIADPALAPTWRPEVKVVTMLPPVDSAGTKEDHWVEDLGHGETMTLLATRTEAPMRRDVLLDVPGAAYGGTWTYEVSPGATPGTTTLKITEAGFIHPPLYRFMMAHVYGPTHNLDQYMKDMQTVAPKL
jgi:uncharacterized protein YndB with AHSA1/START domain